MIDSCGAQEMSDDVLGILGTSSLNDVMGWRAAGLLDEAEFEAVKKSLLARLTRPSGWGCQARGMGEGGEGTKTKVTPTFG